MSDSWEKMRRAKEDEYFEKENSQALKRLKSRDSEKPRLSPITGEPMEQLTMMGVVIDRCPTSGGIWLDAGELEQIIKASSDLREDGEGTDWISRFFGRIFKA